jgi:hypothetical protein
MATKRVDRIIERAVRHLRTVKDMKVDEGLFEVLADSLNEAQIELCRKHRALPTITTMKTEADQPFYGIPFPIAAFGSIVPPSGSKLSELTVIREQSEWVLTKATQTGLTEPTFAFVFGDKIELWPAPTEANEEYTIYAYRYPERIVERGYDPEVGPEWDRALRFGVLRDYNPEFEGRFLAEAMEVGHSRMIRSRQSPPKIGTRITDELGF